MTGAILSLAVALAAAIGALIYLVRRLSSEMSARARCSEDKAALVKAREVAEREVKRLANENHKFAAMYKIETERLKGKLREANELLLSQAEPGAIRRMLDDALKGGR